ncbi:hypothetical protein [Vibrio sp. VB16]|nr:hypothetical protein [Vibrio sp. VB16]UGA55296.1 hypothetical protein IUZ65_002790 [Vibrio sp. VB16]
MKLNKATVMPIVITAGLTIALIAVINNVSTLKPVKDTVYGNSGWF